MAHLIQPCCSHRHLGELRSKLGKSGTAEFEGYGDLSLTELLPPLLNHYNGVDLLIAAPSLPDQAADIIKSCMGKEWPLMDGSGKIPIITHLTVVADLSEAKSPTASRWLRENPWGERLTLTDTVQEETAIVLPDFAITGPVNMRYGNPFTATATTDPETVRALWERFARPAGPEQPIATEHTDDTEKPETTDTKEPAVSPEPRRRNGRRAKDATVEPAASEEPAGDAAL